MKIIRPLSLGIIQSNQEQICGQNLRLIDCLLKDRSHFSADLHKNIDAKMSKIL